jgi:glycosyltransferase involved in cell wall biosynthesis
MDDGISVALCTYNGARFLAKQIDSILDQTVRPFEIVIRDDGSSDATLSIIEEYGDALTLQPAGERLGVTRNFEEAVSSCSGAYVALSDQDDIWEPDKLERMRTAFAGNDTLRLVGSNATAIDENDNPMGFDLFSAIALTSTENSAVSSGRGFDALIKRPLFTGATVMFRRDLLEDALPFPADWMHDEWLAIIAAATGQVRLLPDRLTQYRQHGTNVAGIKQNTVQRRLSKLRKLTAPRTSRYRTLRARRTSLAAHLKGIDASPDTIAISEAALTHEEFRSGLPSSRALRIGPVMKERPL